MKALTISQPFASLIADGEKICENRTWPTNYRGTLLIHAGKGSKYLGRAELAKQVRSAIVAKAVLQHCYHIETLRRMSPSHVLMIDGERHWSVADVLAHKHTEGPYCWLLNRIEKLEKPITCSGSLGLWDFKESF